MKIKHNTIQIDTGEELGWLEGFNPVKPTKNPPGWVLLEKPGFLPTLAISNR